MDQTWENGEAGVQTSEEQIPDWEVVPRALPVTRKCSFPFCDDDTSPLPLPLSHGELTQLSLKQRVPSASPFPPLSTNPYAGILGIQQPSLENKNFLYTKHTLTLANHLGSLSPPGTQAPDFPSASCTKPSLGV